MVKTVDGAVRSMHGLSVEQLLAAVENELIPRLMVSHAEKLPADADAGDEPPASGPWASDEAVASPSLHVVEPIDGEVYVALAQSGWVIGPTLWRGDDAESGLEWSLHRVRRPGDD